MNYNKIYFQIIEGAKNRILDISIYTEIHHIIPRCIGGNNSKENLIILTAKEHFLAHLLLAKIHGGKLIQAAFMMSNMKRYNSRKYSWLKEVASKINSDRQKEQMKDEKYREKVFTKERGNKISTALKGKEHSENHIKNQISARRINGTYVQSEEQKKLLSEANLGSKNPMYGKTHTKEASKRISEANKQKTECPYCNKIGGIAIMLRWHFNNCKLSPTYAKPPKVKRMSPTIETREKISRSNKGKVGNWKNKKLPRSGVEKMIKTRLERGSYKSSKILLDKKI